MYTGQFPTHLRKRVKRAARKLARERRAQIRAGGPTFGASINALRSLRKAHMALRELLVTQGIERARAEGVI